MIPAPHYGQKTLRKVGLYFNNIILAQLINLTPFILSTLGEKIHTRWKSRLRTSIPATDQLGAEVDFSGCELAVVPSVLMQRVASILVLRLGNNHLTSWPPIESNNLVVRF